MNLLREYIQQYIDDTKKNEMRISVIGERERLSADLREKIAHLEALTREKKGLHVIIALNYGGRDEILRAVRKLAADVQKGSIRPEAIDSSLFERYLDTFGIPDPDLWIRTGGDIRLSNFLLWQISYSELYFSDKLWPDFDKNDLLDAIRSYQQRERRFGGRSRN
jgi:undecaprenyl diphosphate synthase